MTVSLPGEEAVGRLRAGLLAYGITRRGASALPPFPPAVAGSGRRLRWKQRRPGSGIPITVARAARDFHPGSLFVRPVPSPFGTRRRRGT